jgi:uncharacterized protein (DUF433 family)
MRVLHNPIIASPEIMLGKPVVRGTRLTMELMLRKMSEGATVADLRQMYPQLEAVDIEASLHYAATKAAE